jgi:hypothetical protein
MNRLVMLLAACSLGGCVGPTVVMMKNPQTGEIVRCSGDGLLSMAADSWAAKGCADGYQAAGWARLN